MEEAEVGFAGGSSPPGSAMHGWFSHSGSPQTESSAVTASASGAVAGTSSGTGTRARSGSRSGWNADGPSCKSSAPGGTDMVGARHEKKKRDRAWNCTSSNPPSRRHVLPVAMD